MICDSILFSNHSVNSKTVLEGGEKITIKFANYKVFRAPRGGCLTVQELSTNLNSNLITSINTASSLSWFAKYTAYLGIVVTIVMLIVGGGSMEMLWSLLNAMQIISYNKNYFIKIKIFWTEMILLRLPIFVL